MDLRDDRDQSRFRADLRQWLRGHWPEPAADRPPTTNGGGPAPRQWAKLLHEAGYAGLTWPVVHGGAGLAASYQGIFVEESVLAGAPDHHNVIGLHMVGPTLIRYGTAAQQARHLTAILAGDHLFCQGFSEPEAGSDLAAVRTRAVADGDGFRVSGEKLWSSYAHTADYCLLLARTGAAEPKHRGLTCFLLDMRAPGVTIRPLRMINGDRNFSQLILEDVRLSDDSVVGAVDQGWSVAMTTLAHERGTFGITLTARLSRQFDHLLATIRALGLSADLVVRQTVANLYVQVQALRFTGYRVLAAVTRTGDPGPASSVLKLHWSEVHQRLVAFATELIGAPPTGGVAAAWAGYWHGERLRSRGNSIEGGTSEVLRGVIAERVAGLPRSR